MSSDETIETASDYLIKDLEWPTGLFYRNGRIQGRECQISISPRDFNMEYGEEEWMIPKAVGAKLANSNHSVSQRDAFHHVIQRIKSNIQLMSLRIASGNQSGFNNQVTMSVDVKPKFCNELRRVLAKPFIRFEGVLVTENGGAEATSMISVRISCDDIELQRDFIKQIVLDVPALSAGTSYTSYGNIIREIESRRMNLPDRVGLHLPYINQNNQIKLRLSIIVEWSQPSLTPTVSKTASIKLSADTILQKRYANDSTKDYSIVAGNGLTIKCHGFILASHSQVLDRMISPSNRMKESEEKRIVIKEMTEQGINSLLEYMYGLEVKFNELSCKLVVELFQAAHKYELGHLEEQLADILLAENEKWYNPDHILELYFFVKLLEQFKTLRDHVLWVMTRMASELQTCEKIKTLGKADTAELLWQLFEAKK